MFGLKLIPYLISAPITARLYSAFFSQNTQARIRLREEIGVAVSLFVSCAGVCLFVCVVGLWLLHGADVQAPVAGFMGS